MAEIDEAERQLEDTCFERDEARGELVIAINTIDDLTVQCKFWRQAAEHAVMGWNLLEDKCAATLEALNAIEDNADTVRALLGLEEECAPPLEDLLRELPTVDLGNGKLRVVEDEKPFSFPRMSDAAEKQED